MIEKGENLLGPDPGNVVDEESVPIAVPILSFVLLSPRVVLRCRGGTGHPFDSQGIVS